MIRDDTEWTDDAASAKRALFAARRVAALFRCDATKATAFAGLLTQMGRPLLSMLTLPLLLSYLGQGGLGVWMIALSMMGLIGFISSGLSASVITAIGRAGTEITGDTERRLVTAAALIAASWGIIVLLFAVPAALVIDWARLLGLGNVLSGDDVSRLMAVLFALLACGIVASVPRQVIFGRMHGYLAHLIDFAGIVAGAIGLVAGIYCGAPLWGLGLAFMGPSTLTILVGGLIYLRHARIPLFSWANLDRTTVAALGFDSLKMAGYQGAFAVSSQSDLLLIGAVLGAHASAAYAIAHRIFSLPVLASTTVNYAQWPAMARADAAGDRKAVSRMFGRTLVIGSGVATAAAVVVAWGYEPLIRVWLGRKIDTDALIIAGMAAWVLVATLVNTCDSLLRARQETAFLMRWMIAMAVVNIAVTLVLLPRIGPAGAIWGSVIAYTLALLVPFLIRLRGVIGAARNA